MTANPNPVTDLYDDPNLLQDPDYTTAVCGWVIHVDDVATHNDDDDPCELCKSQISNPLPQRKST